MNSLPSIFVSHGSPMQALDGGRTSEAWRALAGSLPTPRAVLAVSAHWETGAPVVSAAASPPTIHDFGGFPEPLFQIQYPAPGAPWLAERVRDLLAAGGLPAEADPRRGLDHGAWVPLREMYPHADVPVAQLSIQPLLGTAHHVHEVLIAGDADALMDYRQRAPGAARAHPSDEHLLPLHVAFGAGGDGATARRVHTGISEAALAMDAYAFSR